MKIKNCVYALLSVVITLLLCKVFTQMGMDNWYNTTPKPSIVPPNYVFPIVWNILYVLLAVSFYLVLGSRNNKKATYLYVSQLALQVLWCFAFFAMQYVFSGLVILIFLNILAIMMMFEFKKLKKITIYMILPYNLWLVFALILNIAYI